MVFISYKIEPGASKMERCALHVGRWVTKMIPKGIKMEPKGPNIDQKGAERGPKNIKKSMHEKRLAQGQLPGTRRVTKSRQFDRKGRPGDRFWRSFWYLFPSKMRLKTNPEIGTEKT